MCGDTDLLGYDYLIGAVHYFPFGNEFEKGFGLLGAIIADKNKNKNKPTEEKADKPKSNRGRKPKAKTENNIEVVK